MNIRKVSAILLVIVLLAPLVNAQEKEMSLIAGGPSADSLILPSAVSTDSNGNIYIINEGSNEILSITANHNYRFRFGGFGDSNLVEPAHVLYNRGRIIVSDIGCLKVFDQKGRLKETITKIGDYELVRPMGLSSDSRNRIYVSDPLLGKVIITESDFRFYKVIEENLDQPIQCFLTNSYRYVILDRGLNKGLILSSYLDVINDFGAFNNPLSMVTDGTRRIYVLTDGMIYAFGISGDSRPNWNISPKKPGGLYPSMSLNDETLLLSSKGTGELISVSTSDGKVETLIEHDSSVLCLPSCHAVDENGRIYVSDGINNKIRILDQLGQNLFIIPTERPGRIDVSTNLLSVVECDGGKINMLTREGGELYSLDVADAVDCVFTDEEDLLVLTVAGHIDRYSGSVKERTIIADEDAFDSPIAIDCEKDYIAVAHSDGIVSVLTRLGEFAWSDSIDAKVHDIMLLSPQRVIAITDKGMVLLSQINGIMESFGSSGGPFTAGVKDEPVIDYTDNLDKFTHPVSISQFGDWLYVLDKAGMRLVRYLSSVLMSSPKVKILPEVINFGDVPADSEMELDVVIKNIGGDTLEGSFSIIPDWISVSSKRFNGDDVVIKVKAKTLHFISNMRYREDLVLDTNAGRVSIPCELRVPRSEINQIDITIQIGNRIAKIDDEEINLGVAPYIKNSKTMVPLRFISEAFGGSVDFYNGFIDVTFPKKNIWISIAVGSATVVLDIAGESSFGIINPPPEIKSETTFVPLTFFTDILECEKYWNNDDKSIRLVFIQD